MKFNDPDIKHRLSLKEKELELAEEQLKQAYQAFEAANQALTKAIERQGIALKAVWKCRDELWGMEKESGPCNK